MWLRLLGASIFAALATLMASATEARERKFTVELSLNESDPPFKAIHCENIDKCEADGLLSVGGETWPVRYRVTTRFDRNPLEINPIAVLRAGGILYIQPPSRTFLPSENRIQASLIAYAPGCGAGIYAVVKRCDAVLIETIFVSVHKDPSPDSPVDGGQ